MKRGRPTNHMAAKWVTFTQGSKEMFFELEKGKLVSVKNYQPHHVKHIENTKHIPIKVESFDPATEIATSPAEINDLEIINAPRESFELDVEYPLAETIFDPFVFDL